MSRESLQHPLRLGGNPIAVAIMGVSKECRNDFTLGPVVSGCRGDFDFTVLFEHAFLSVVPSACFLFLFSYRICYLRGKPAFVRGSVLSSIKVVSVFD